MSGLGYFLSGGAALHRIGVPYWVVFGAAFVFVFVRSCSLYYAGRVAERRAVRSRFAGILQSRRFTRAVDALHRHGIVAVALSYVVVGTGTVVMAGAGFIQMPWRRFLIGLVPCSIIWAVTRMTIGLAVINLVIYVVRWNPVVSGIVIALVVLAAAVVVVRWRARAARGAPLS